jgi:cell division protein ZipA
VSRDTEPAEEPAPKATTETEKEAQMTLLLTVTAPKSGPFNGIDILEAARDLGLKLSKNGTLDYVANTGRGDTPVFGIAHLREPGVFSLDTVSTLTTPGLLVFMQLPGPLEDVTSVDTMLNVVGRLAERLRGVICDERRKRLTSQGLESLRDSVVEFASRRAQPPLP